MTACAWAGMDSASLYKTWCCSSIIWHCSKEPVVISKNAWLSKFSFVIYAPVNVPKSWGQLTLVTNWSSSNCCKALGCIWGHYPAAVWIILHKDANQKVKHVSDEWSGTSPWSSRCRWFDARTFNSSVNLQGACLFDCPSTPPARPPPFHGVHLETEPHHGPHQTL